jgi:hypothetical protein
MPRKKAFKFDPSEALYTPHLTPVYFGPHVLARYLHNPRFYCDFHSETYGTVGDVGRSFNIAFGINRNGSVIAWLGDLDDLPTGERRLWVEENIPAEGDIASEFFDGQIGADFTPPPLPVVCLNELTKLDSAFARQYGVHLYKTRSLEDRIGETRRYKRLVFNNADDFKRFLSELNEIVVESTNNDGIRAFLKAKSIPFDKGIKGNKLLEKVYTNVLADTENLVAPFFYRYDLRLWSDHSGKENLLPDVANRLGVADMADYNAIMGSLLKAMIASCVKLSAMI